MRVTGHLGFARQARHKENRGSQQNRPHTPSRWRCEASSTAWTALTRSVAFVRTVESSTHAPLRVSNREKPSSGMLVGDGGCVAGVSPWRGSDTRRLSRPVKPRGVSDQPLPPVYCAASQITPAQRAGAPFLGLQAPPTLDHRTSLVQARRSVLRIDSA
ncbi:hypothetical protein GQ53DRAFT_456940 [Thozetella sp. PMI_491]|nr:hypothetical protein GQ53DRAFT_456940 [Thozetella sp. PMI_491]